MVRDGGGVVIRALGHAADSDELKKKRHRSTMTSIGWHPMLGGQG